MTSLHKARNRGDLDLEAWEEAIRNAVLRYGANLLEGLLASAGCGRRKDPVLDENKQPMHSIGVRHKTITTLLGKVTLARSVFQNEQGTQSCIPLDESLGVNRTSFSPGVRRFMARAGSNSSFVDACEDLLIYARLDVTPKQVQRIAEEVGRSIEGWNGREAANQPSQEASLPAVPIMYVSYDGTGVPMRKSELSESKGKASDGKARTREVKLGCVFTQTTTDEKDRPVRDPDSTTYVGAIESSEIFGWRIYQEALRRGIEQASTTVVLTDGARYNKTIAAIHFPNAVHIIDLYHAREHLTKLGKTLCLNDAGQAAWRDLLRHGAHRRHPRRSSRSLK